MKAAQDLEVEMESPRKTQTEALERSLTNRIQDKEEEYQPVKTM